MNTDMRLQLILTDDPNDVADMQATELIAEYQRAVNNIMYDAGRGTLTHTEARARLGELKLHYEQELRAVHARNHT